MNGAWYCCALITKGENMKKIMFVLVVIIAILGSVSVMASFKSVSSKKAIICYADDNQSWILNANRTTIKYTVEGESLGALKIFDTKTDDETYISFSTEEGTLTLSKKGDFYQFAEEDRPSRITCK
jgi:hypothetical protein